MKHIKKVNSLLPKSDEILEFIFRDRMEHLGVMSSALVHEMQTPLVIMRGRVESLLRHPEQDVERGLREISEECRHLLKLLDSMTFVSSGDKQPLSENLALYSLVDDVLVFFENICIEKGITLRNEVPTSIRINSDPARIKSILMSLIKNSVESFAKSTTESQRSIVIHTQKDPKCLHLVVSDTGSGMCPLVQTRVFKTPFFSTKVNHKGSGLGLSLAQKMANDLKLEISFVSHEDRGTSFSLSFPTNIYSIDSGFISGS